jgi:hypothetical protein
MLSSKFILQRGHCSTFSAANTIAHPIIALHFGHLIPMYSSTFPAANKETALYKKVLNNVVGIYFSVNANMAIAEKPIATRIKYNFFLLFILSLGLIISLSALIERLGQVAGAQGIYQVSRPLQPVRRAL